MNLSDFLCRIKIGKSNPHEVILISFDLQEVLQQKYINTRSGAQNAGITVGNGHGNDKALLQYMKLEKRSKSNVYYM